MLVSYLRLPRGLSKFEKMADDFNNASRFHRFTIPPPQLDSPGPYLFHGASEQNQFSQ